MTRVLYTLPAAILTPSNLTFPGMERFKYFFDLYGHWTFNVDRTGVMTTPVDSVRVFPVPTFRPFTKSYEEVCNERAAEVLQRADTLGKTLYFMYSGGIDSTCALVSILKQATPQQKKNIVVMLTQTSIAESPRFYDEHLAGKMRLESSVIFPQLLGKELLVSGEHNDMIMGSEKIGRLIISHGPEHVHRPYSRDTMFNFYGKMLGDDAPLTNFYLDLFERIADAAPIPIRTNLEFLWWINFAFKWHSCYYYILLFTPSQNTSLITQEYLDSEFVSFYNNDDFQLWSMNNTHMRIKDTWKSYKWVCKDIIYEYTKDADYRDNKTKRGSLTPLTGYNPPQRFILEGNLFTNDIAPEEYLSAENDFV